MSQQSGMQAGQAIFIGIAVSVVVALIALIVFGSTPAAPDWLHRLLPWTGNSVQADSSTSTSSNSSDDSWPETEGQAQYCDAKPDMKVVSVENVGNDLVVTILVTTNCGDDTPSELNDSSTRITLSDNDGNTVADAVFDFSGTNSTLVDGTDGAKIKVSYSPTQYYRPAAELVNDPALLIIRYIYASKKGSGAATSSGSSSQNGTIGGVSSADDESEENARKALEWQIQHDKSAAQQFYSTYTTQLSSKRKDMVVDGKTWSYRDILAQFISLRNTHPNTLLIWSGDWPTYDSNSTKYYVILSGEGFSTTSDAWAWCSANGYSEVDCLPVDLQ